MSPVRFSVSPVASRCPERSRAASNSGAATGAATILAQTFAGYVAVAVANSRRS
jgi:hypothetical protein